MYYCNILFLLLSMYVNFRFVEVGEEIYKFEVMCIMYLIVYLLGLIYRGVCYKLYWG